MTSQDHRLGLLYALAGFAVLSVGDAIVKTMAGQWSPIAVAALRFTIGAIGLAAILRVREGAQAFRPQRMGLQIFRGFCLAMATICFFSAIFFMPLAEATALVFVAPIITALLSGPILGEKAAPVTWLASLVALCGVLIVLRPNLAEVGLVALLPLASATFFSAMMIANRAVAAQGSSLSMQMFIACFAAPILIIAALFGQTSGIEAYAFGWPEPMVVLKCAIVACTASTAHWMVYIGTAKASAATVAPMTYVQLLVAIVLGWFWFGDAPDLMTIIGSATIIAAGLMVWASTRASTGASTVQAASKPDVSNSN